MIPMPKVEMTYQDDYRDYRRIELGFASLAAYPWKDQTFSGHGHTIPFKNIKGKDFDDYISPEEYLELRKLVGWSLFPLEEAKNV